MAPDSAPRTIEFIGMIRGFLFLLLTTNSQLGGISTSLPLTAWNFRVVFFEEYNVCR